MRSMFLHCRSFQALRNELYRATSTVGVNLEAVIGDYEKLTILMEDETIVNSLARFAFMIEREVKKQNSGNS